MIKIKTSELKNFFRRTRGVKHNNIIPILSFFKMDCIGDKVIITDTNSFTYIIHEMPGEFKQNGSYLIDRKIMSSMVEGTTSEYITITPKGKKIILSDDLGPVGFQTDDPTLYHKVPARNNVSQIKLNADLMETMQTAKHFCFNDGKSSGVNPLELLHISGTPDHSEIFASDSFLLYLKKVTGDGLNVLMLPENCNLLAGFTETIFYESGNYVFFECGVTTYGFVKSELKTPQYQMIVKDIVEKDYFIIDKEKIVSFCDRATSINPSKIYPECIIRDAGKNKIQFSFNNIEHDVECDMEFEVVKSFTADEFKFNANQMLKLISSLPYQQLIFISNPARYYLKTEEDKNYIGCIQRLL